jgi:hypothetical protein
MAGNLPDGVTQAMLDRYYEGLDRIAEESEIDACEDFDLHEPVCGFPVPDLDIPF